ncbi:TadE-like protein [Lampropedia hyalina DSM 16112]|uniref:TadE-like protein n=1 Tax=Lampropedia hyalina DSM 16112 TaxID=1122156 RepID=A0A1M4VC59_9BURK|nr:TadE/TadG family type IV pilus assembly protein [Lampropedia hyalina]SHE66522.1 TadE-like protein [Lampropedia hyalina DSM 16112]
MRSPSTPPPPTRRPQRGIYALEWAIIFPVFFALLYGIISYGLTFLVRESMQFAVEEGARAALRYPSTATLAGASQPTWLHRQTEARAAVIDKLNWLPTALRPSNASVNFNVCHLDDTACQTETSLQNSNILCSAAQPCLVLVSYEIEDYASNAIAPPLPGFSILLPDSLNARASILADRRML